MAGRLNWNTWAHLPASTCVNCLGKWGCFKAMTVAWTNLRKRSGDPPIVLFAPSMKAPSSCACSSAGVCQHRVPEPHGLCQRSLTSRGVLACSKKPPSHWPSAWHLHCPKRRLVLDQLPPNRCTPGTTSHPLQRDSCGTWHRLGGHSLLPTARS